MAQNCEGKGSVAEFIVNLDTPILLLYNQDLIKERVVSMLNNYNYFLVLAQEMSISKAAQRLFISHQCLSSYLKNLECHYGVSLFIRKPKFSLAPAGKELLDSFLAIERIERNLESRLKDMKDEQTGIINYGITEGRYRILIPLLLKEYRRLYPNVQLNVIDCPSLEMETKLLNNELDMFVSGTGNLSSPKLKFETLLNERVYLVISDNLLREYFPDIFPQCKEIFRQGADLRLFQKVPFVLNKPYFNSRIIIERHLDSINARLNCIMECTQPDIHHLLSNADYAASFCLSMYIPGVEQLNQNNSGDSKLNIFPISGLDMTNTMAIIYNKDSIFPKYAKDLIKLTKEICHKIV